MNTPEKPIEKFDEVYNKGKGKIEILIPLSKYMFKRFICIFRRHKFIWTGEMEKDFFDRFWKVYRCEYCNKVSNTQESIDLEGE